jgi:septal ring factor EnvC (AmiA/AmiB activator)
MDETAALRIQRVEERDSALDAAAALAAEAEDLRALIARLAGTATLESEAARADGLPVPDTKPDAADLAAIAPAAGTEDGGVVAALAQPLRLPVAGAITRGFGEPVGDGTRSRGLVIGAREAAQVVAPSAGTVVYAGAFKDLGQLLILAHGEEYHSVLAGFARIDVAVGQAVTSGEPVGIVGADAGGTTSLYVELRRHGEPVDPLPWLRTAFSEDIR